MFWKKKEKLNSGLLISAAYLAQISQLHATDINWGTSGGHYADHVINAAEAMGAKSILDYGCGKGVLLTHLADDVDERIKGISLQGYDPAVDGFTDTPLPADLVVCTDVLEHIELDCLRNVLSHLQELCKIGGIFVIHSGPASHKLPDGRNAHLIQKPLEWWAEQLLEFFVIDQVIPMGEYSFMVAVHPWTENMARTIEELANFNPGDPVPHDLGRKLKSIEHLLPPVHEPAKRRPVKLGGLSIGNSYKESD